MKTLSKILLGLMLFAFSCQSEREKVNESFAGTWKLEEMSYTDSLGVVNTISDSNISLTFLNDIKETSSNGYEIVDKDTIVFSYSIDHEFNDIDIMLNAHLDTVKLPLAAIGRMQVYHWDKIDKKTIEFSADLELEHSSTLLIRNTSYLFTKIANLPK